MGLFNKPVGELCQDCQEGYLTERINSKTKNTFLGCSEFPDCKFTKAGGANPAQVRGGYNSLRDELDDDIDSQWNDIDWGEPF